MGFGGPRTKLVWGLLVTQNLRGVGNLHIQIKQNYGFLGGNSKDSKFGLQYSRTRISAQNAYQLLEHTPPRKGYAVLRSEFSCWRVLKQLIRILCTYPVRLYLYRLFENFFWLTSTG